MKFIYLSEDQIDQYELFTKDYSVEAEIRKYNENELLKIYYNFNFYKQKTLESVELRKKELNLIEEFLIFKAYILDPTSNKLLGILINKGYNKTLNDYSKIASFSDLIAILKKIGTTLNHLKVLREQEGILKNFAIGDLQERNILVEEKTKNIQFIDLDSCTIDQNISYYAKNLLSLKSHLPKNLGFKYSIDGFKIIKCNFNTDIYCYLAMILKHLFNYDIATKPIDIKSYYNYLEALKEAGLPQPIYDAFYSLFQNQNNLNPYQYLEDIPYTFERKKGQNPF